MHYAVPRILNDARMLTMLHTDICAVKGWPALVRQLMPNGWQPRGLRRLMGRVPNDVPPEKIQAYTSFGWEYAKKRQAARGVAETTNVHLWAGEKFCKQIIDYGLGEADAVYTFNSAGLELLQEAKRRGLMAVMEQTIAPYRIELELLAAEQQKFPDWEQAGSSKPYASEFIDREQAEWGHADRIVCGSEFVRQGVRNSGGPHEKCVVIPYGVDPDCHNLKRQPHDGPLRVLTIGAIGLRKGSPYVLEAAKQLKGQAIFRLVGTIGVPSKVEYILRKHLELTGVVPRSAVHEQFAWADVFLLPSICEGSATVVYEALAAGLPVICTPNTGSVVTDGVEGFIVPPGDILPICDYLSILNGSRELLHKMGEAAQITSKLHDVKAYGLRLTEALRRD